MWDISDFDSIRISIASPEDIRSWSSGEVRKPETINYRSHKPERDGLFCERIFGPSRDWECSCGKYKSIRYKGVICEKCGVEVTRSKVRRERMGHITLASPVAHIWYTKGTPSYIALLLDISPRDLEKVVYFNSYIVIDPGNLPLMKKQLLTEGQYRELHAKYGELFTAKMGAEAIKMLLQEVELAPLIEDLKIQLKESTGTKKQNVVKRLEVGEMFHKSMNRPEWMILEIIPVIPPDLRPMVQLDGGRFATSDLNDLYRRVINRNNRLKRLLDLGAPDIIIKNEKRMLQEAVNSLIDNGRRGRPVTGPGKRPLKSLSDMLKGKQGRFRQNLLGKRVDYSGRSVIVVGPALKLHECGLPKKMALELFKPFIMNRLVTENKAPNIKSAKKMLERNEPEVFDVLEEVTKEHPVLLNRAPTLHRLGIQAFQPVLIDGKAIQIHPLVCTAFNADFDGDQMAVHVPLLMEAQVESNMLMLSSKNLFSPSSGKPITLPTQDMCIGCYYLTRSREPQNTIILKNEKKQSLSETLKGRKIPFKSAQLIIDPKTEEVVIEPKHFITNEQVDKLEKLKIKQIEVFDQKIFPDPKAAVIAFEVRPQQIDLHSKIFVKIDGKMIETTVGRIIFNEVLPPEMGYYNAVVDKGKMSDIITSCYRKSNIRETARVLDELMQLGFHYATISGLSFSVSELLIPPRKREILETAQKKVDAVHERFLGGSLNREEKRQNDIDIWMEAGEEVTDDMLQSFKQMEEEGHFNSVYAMAISGARGNIQQIRQLAGMRGLMSNPQGDIVDFPIKTNFREGLRVTEYFISTYGARKGLVDTALRTADSGYLTRRMVDVAQDVIIMEDDCGTNHGIEVAPLREKRTPNNLMVDELVIPLRQRVVGRLAAHDIIHPGSGEIIVAANEMINDEKGRDIERAETNLPVSDKLLGHILAEMVINPRTNSIILRADREITEDAISRFLQARIDMVKIRPRVIVRSPITCKSRYGICKACYGWDLSTGRLVDMGEAVGIIAAQSIGEPGTQLTMRTFHIGGIALAQRLLLKSKIAGIVNLDDLKWTFKTERRKQVITGVAIEESEDTGLDKDVRRIVLSGYIEVVTPYGKKERYYPVTGAALKVLHNQKVAVGDMLVEYNPNQVVTEHGGTVQYRKLDHKDGIVVSEMGSIVVERADKPGEFDQYPVKQGAYLKVARDEKVTPGDILAEVVTEQKAAIAGQDGRVEFLNIKSKNLRVISDSGIIFITPLELKKRMVAKYKLPRGVKERKEEIDIISQGVVLKVKNGNEVRYNDELLGIYSEIDGVVSLKRKNLITVTKETSKDYFIPSDLEAVVDEEKNTVAIASKGEGMVKLLTSKTGTDKTQDKRRIVVNLERIYMLPKDLKLFMNQVKIQPGESVAANEAVTHPLVLSSQLDGVVSVEKPFLDEESGKFIRRVVVRNLSKISLTDKESIKKKIANRISMNDIIDVSSGELILERAQEITEELANRMLLVSDIAGKISYEKEVEMPVNENLSLVGKILTESIRVGKKLIGKLHQEIDIDLEKKIKGLKDKIPSVKVENNRIHINNVIEIKSIDDTLSKHVGTCLEKDVTHVRTGNVFAKAGQPLTKQLVRKFAKEKLNISQVVLGEERDYYVPRGAEMRVKNGENIKQGTELIYPVHLNSLSVLNMLEEYEIPEGAKVCVKDRDKVKVGDSLIEEMEPITTEIDGKVNYITRYDKATGEDVVTKIGVYYGEEHIIPAGLPLKVKKGMFVKQGDLLTEPIGFKSIEDVDGGRKIIRVEKIEKKYRTVPTMEVLVQEEEEVRRGRKLALLTNFKFLSSERIVLDKENCYKVRFAPILTHHCKVFDGSDEVRLFDDVSLVDVEPEDIKERILGKKLKEDVILKDSGKVLAKAKTIINKKLADKIVEERLNIAPGKLPVTEPNIRVLYSTGEVYFKSKPPKGSLWRIEYAHDQDGVIHLVKRRTKEGKIRTTIGEIRVRTGESHQVLDGAELKVEDVELPLRKAALVKNKLPGKVVRKTIFDMTTGEIIHLAGQVATRETVNEIVKPGRDLNVRRVRCSDYVKKGTILAKWGISAKKTIDIIQGLPRVADLFEIRRPKVEAFIVEDDGEIRVRGSNIQITTMTGEKRQYKAQFGTTKLMISDGELVKAGDQISEGNLSPRKLAKVAGITAGQRYLIDEIQQVYKAQGVTINEKHIEVIVRQMMRKVRVMEPGASEFLPSEIVHINDFKDKNRGIIKAGREPAKGKQIFQGITKASLTTDSFISAASFQETTRVLTRAAIEGKIDCLKGLKENLIIGKLIPAGTGLPDIRGTLLESESALSSLLGDIPEDAMLESDDEMLGENEELVLEEGKVLTAEDLKDLN